MTALLTDNLPLLAGAPNGIKKLRELILELAVRGKLVPQDPSDKSASELLKRIAEEKARLVADGKIKKQKPLSEIGVEDQAFELPAGWVWARLSDVVNVLNGRAYKKEELLDAGTPVLRVGNLFTSKHWYYSSLTLEEDKYCNPGDLLFAWSASFGPFIWQGERSIYHYHIWKLDLYAEDQPNKNYLYNFLLEQTQEIKAAGHGVSMVHMTKEKMEKLVVPVPPLPEQHRIVAKVDKLMALCDRLEAQQTGAESAHVQLVQALLDSLTQASDATDFAASWQRLAEHFHTLFITEASIDALKQTLLQLAVMGKLAPQDPSDESAESLLQRNSVKSQPHTLRGWAEVPLGHLGEILGGSTPSKANAEFWGGDIPWVSPKDMKRPVIHDSEDHISAKALAKTSLKVVPPKSLLMVVRGMILVHSFPVALTAREVTINQDMKALVPPNEISDYLLMYLQAAKAVMVGLVDRSSHGTCKLISEKLWSHTVFLPPRAEQHRIVAKVDQLMALCDQLKTRLTQDRQLNEQLASTLVERALVEDRKAVPVATDRKAARTLLAAELTHQLHGLKTFGQRKLQKVIYLAEHAAKVTAIQGDYLRDAAGPHDRQLMNQVEGELQNCQWYERIERETVGHAYRPLAAAGQHRQAYESTWPAEVRASIQQVIELMRGWDTDRCERVVTLYAAWNDLLLEGKAVSDEAIVAEVMYGWNDTKLRFSKSDWLAELTEMKKRNLLTPTGFGKRTLGGLQTLPGLH